MQIKYKILARVLPLILLLNMMNLAAQQEQEDNQKHLLGPAGGITFVPLGSQLEDTDARGLFAPVVGIDYFYHFHHRWGAGILSALELNHYVVTDDQIERQNAIILALLGMYRPTKYLDLFIGGGIEVEQHDNQGLLRLGFQYSIDVGRHWAMVPKLYFDFKGNYNTWSLALTFARKL